MKRFNWLQSVSKQVMTYIKGPYDIIQIQLWLTPKLPTQLFMYSNENPYKSYYNIIARVLLHNMISKAAAMQLSKQWTVMESNASSLA